MSTEVTEITGPAQHGGAETRGVGRAYGRAALRAGNRARNQPHEQPILVLGVARAAGPSLDFVSRPKAGMRPYPSVPPSLRVSLLISSRVLRRLRPVRRSTP